MDLIFGLIRSFKNDSFQNYLKYLLWKLKIVNNVKFIGYYDAKGFKEELLRSNLFLLCSTIENSPNSLKEAIQLNVPSIAHKIGGVASTINGSFGNGSFVKTLNSRILPPNIIYKGSLPLDELATFLSKSKFLVNLRPIENNFNNFSFPSKIFTYMSIEVPVISTDHPNYSKILKNYLILISNYDEESIHKHF